MKPLAPLINPPLPEIGTQSSQYPTMYRKPGTRSHKWRLAAASALLGVLGLWATNASAQINWISADAGNPTLKGSVTDNHDGTFSIVGGGDDIWNNSSNFHFYYAWASGTTWDLVVQVQSFAGPDYWSKVELMVCASDPTTGPQGNDAFVAAMETQPSTAPTGGVAGDNELGVDQFRTVRAGAADWHQAGTSPHPAPPNWMKIHRNGSQFEIWYSYDGINYTNYTTIDTAVTQWTGQDNGTSFGPSTAFPNIVAVGVGVTAHNDANTSGATAVIANLSGTFPAVQAPTAVNAVVQVQNAATKVGSEASFSFSTTNNSVPNVVLPTYQWYKNGVALAGATGTALTFLAAQPDNNAQVYCVATVPAPYNTIISSVNSTTGMLSVASANIYTNGLKREFFANTTSRTAVEAGNVKPATSVTVRPNFDDPGGYGNNYIQRLSGYFIPPTSDNYVFFVSSDDDSDLFLSTDSTPGHKALIAQETTWSGFDSWLTAGSGLASQKRSDQWSPDGGATVPWAAGIPLTQGQLYYIEGVMHQGGGGDDYSVTYQTMTQMTNVNWAIIFTNGVPSLLEATNKNIAFISYPDTTPVWTLQPTNATATQGNAVSFYALATDSGEFPPNYQWYKAGVPVPGGTGSTLYIASVAPSDNGASVFAVATAVISGLSSTSSIVTLNVASPILETGYAKVEYWYAFANKNTVEAGSAPAPDHTITSPRFEQASANNTAGNNYTARISALFYPPTTDNYVFFINDDDAGDLYVSTDATPGNKRLVAQEAGWSNPWQWNAVGGAPSTVSQKRSDQWSPDGGTTVPYASGIPLTAGQPYYIELVKQDNGGGNNGEATFKRVSDPDPVNGTVSALSGNLIAINVPRSFTVAFTQQPTNVVATFNGAAVFTVAGTTDSQVAVGGTGDPRPLWNNFLAYQWLRNGTAIPGATSSQYAFGPVSPLDSGAQFACQIRSLGYVNNSLVDIWSNSTAATITVSGNSAYEPGFALHEYWSSNPGRSAIENFSAGSPTWSMSSPAFEVDINGTEVADNFNDTLFGFFVPLTTGAYVFFCNSDDDSDLFLSTDSSMVNGRIIAQETGYATPLHWGTSGGTLSQVRSDTYVDPIRGGTPYATGIPLNAGQKYAMWLVHHQGGGGTVSAVTAKLFTDPDPASGSLSTIRGSQVGTYVPACSYVTVTNQPQSVTAPNYSSVSFTAGGTTDSKTPVGPETDWRNSFNNFLIFQWYKNGTAVAGATASTFTIPEVLPSDNGAQIYCGVRALGYTNSAGNPAWANSLTATLTVTTNVPQLVYAAIYTNSNYTNFSGTASNYIVLAFSDPMDPAALSQMSTYTLGGGLTLLSVMVNSNDYRSVALAFSGTPTFPLNVSVSASLSGLGGGLRVGNTQIGVNTVPLTDTDIGFAGVDPAVPGMMYIEGAHAYTIACEGTDIYNNNDGFNFAYEIKTNDFDVVVRQKDITHTSNWAKGGLMVRESLDPGSRNWNIINDPASADGIGAPDGSGLGANAVECNARVAFTGVSSNWAFNANPVPAYPNAWVRLTRVGSLLSAYYSTDGINWTLHATNDPTLVGDMTNLPPAVYVGICTTAHNNDTPGASPLLYLNTVDYDNYNSSFVGLPKLKALVTAGNNITITWTPAVGRLLASPAVAGPNVDWQPVTGGTGGSVTIPIGGGARFFKVVNP